MLRLLLYYVIPFLLPFVGYFTYRYLVTDGRSLLRSTPWFVLCVAGLALVIATLLTLALSGGWQAGGEYAPPRLQGGQVVPGEVRPPGSTGDDPFPEPDSTPLPLPADVY